MLPSIAIRNYNDVTLPPLLLPSVVVHEEFSPKQDPFMPRKRLFPPTPPSSVTSLENLASLATKRRKLSTETPPSTGRTTPTRATTPKSMEVSPSPTLSPSQSAPYAAADTAYPVVSSPATVLASTPALEPASKLASETASISAAAAAEAAEAAAAKSKRQRVGPSCDVCRVRKIKCDATIRIVHQAESLVSLISDSLHAVLSAQDLELLPKYLADRVPLDLLSQVKDPADKTQLVKHVDKLVVFKPCRSCHKKHNAACQFSKGLTRADINIFNRLEKKTGKRAALKDYTYHDYRAAGY